MRTNPIMDPGQVPVADPASPRNLIPRKPVASYVKPMTSATSLEVPVGMVVEVPTSENKNQSIGLRRQYTVRRSPLAQNPFTDPSDEEWQVQVEAEKSIMSPTLRIVNPDIPDETQGDETKIQEQDLERYQPGEHEMEPYQEHATDEQVGLGTQEVISPQPIASPTPVVLEQRSPVMPSVKRVSFASNS